MKIIVSHDIDHITAWEHKNMIIPKHIVRSSIELLTSTLTFKEYSLRIKELIENKWHNIEEIMSFNKRHHIPATFFIGMDNGLGLDYSFRNAEIWTKKIYQNGFDIGVHGIAYESQDKMKEEYEKMKELLNSSAFGIRMHYLRNSTNTQIQLEKCGYLFDTTLRKDINPYKLSTMYEFPLHIMDGDIMYPENERWMTMGIDELKELTIQRVNILKNTNIEYMTFLFHDRYFNNSFSIWKEWYMWSINYFESLGMPFISYSQAIKELDEKIS